jgi:hypothetical protein
MSRDRLTPDTAAAPVASGSSASEVVDSGGETTCVEVKTVVPGTEAEDVVLLAVNQVEVGV